MSEVWDVNWFGSTKTLDVHIGWLRRKLGDDPAGPDLHRDRARGRLPLRRAGGRGAVSLRATLLLALAYVLLLALIALGVPLAVSLRDRVDSEVRGQARSQADVVAATAVRAARPRAAGRRSTRLVRALGRQRARPGDRRRPPRARCSPTRAGGRRAGADYAEPARDRGGARRATASRSPATATRSATDILATAVPVLEHGRPPAPCGSPRASPPSTARCGPRSSTWPLWPASCCCSGWSPAALIAQQIARPIRRLDGAARRSPAATSMPRVAVEGSTEQRSLARAFNEMTAADQAAAAGAAGLRRRRLPPAADPADRAAAAARGARRALPRRRREAARAWRRRWARSTGSR